MPALTWLKPGIWGAVVGAAAVAILGFSTLGWVTTGSAERLASAQADTAVVQALTPFCVAQSGADLQAEAKLAELAALTSPYQRNEFVLKAGWATLPNQELSSAMNRALAASCAAEIGQKLPA